MLILSRKYGQKIYIGQDIILTVTDIDRNVVKIGIEAPRDTQIYRGELLHGPEKPEVPNVDQREQR